MVADILTPTGDLKEICAETKWTKIEQVNDSHTVPLLTVGAEFGALTKDQTSHLDNLINSISNLPPQNENKNQIIL